MFAADLELRPFDPKPPTRLMLIDRHLYGIENFCQIQGDSLDIALRVFTRLINELFATCKCSLVHKQKSSDGIDVP